LRIDGSRDDLRAFRSWFTLNMFAPAGREPPGQMAEELSKDRPIAGRRARSWPTFAIDISSHAAVTRSSHGC